MKRYGFALLALALFGLLKLPFEAGLSREFRAAHFHSTGLNIGIRQQVGQMGFVAALSGFRSVIADGLWIEAHAAWERTEWGRMKVLFDAVTTLQPRVVRFWDMAAYHMGYNASVAAMEDPKQPSAALRIHARDEDYRLAESYYLQGIAFNSDRSALYVSLGGFYKDKLKDHGKAYWAFSEAATRPDVMTYIHRFAAYELAACPGHEREAYDLLVTLFKKGKQERLPSLLKLIDQLQIKLDIPPADRIDIAQDLREATPL